MSKEMDYIYVLQGLVDIPFAVGRKLLIEFLQGKKTHESIIRNKLDKLRSFGSMGYDEDEIGAMIDNLMLNNMIKTVALSRNRFWKVLEITPKGLNEITKPTLYKRKLAYKAKETSTVITDKDRAVFAAFGGFLERYNDEQKKAIISANSKILCVAGAGSGKTTVLTKRIEFLIKYRSIDPRKILAITFTRKARQEMMKRLSNVGLADGVRIETFNSFCEKILKRHNDLIYGKEVRVISYRDKLLMVSRALSNLGTSMHAAISTYFTFAQQRGKKAEQLANIFMNDCFFIRDYFKFKNKQLLESEFDITKEHERSMKLVFGVCKQIEEAMDRKGLRDFADQLIDTLKLFDDRKDLIPHYEHILIDEFQDVNSTQMKLVGLLDAPNLFCVGDPRQSIFGWRGSDINFILNFDKEHPGSETVTLTKNYRSTKHVVDLINKSIRMMGLADLESELEGEKDIKLLKFDSEMGEFEFVIQRILASDIPRKEMFVLARTNRQLSELSQVMKTRGISHVVRSDEVKRMAVAGENDVTLATIHAIKGLEAEMVFLIGCTGNNFPCKGSEHPVIDMVKVEEYDKEEEEKRLFYVAMSRAKKSLYMSHSGKKPTSFITRAMLDLLEERTLNLKPAKQVNVQKNYSGDLYSRLKEWRLDMSRQLGVAAYVIMHDRTIEDIVMKKPLSLEDLRDVHGMGPTKIMKYGDEILKLVSC